MPRVAEKAVLTNSKSSGSLDLEKLNARLRSQSHTVQAGRKQDEIARFQPQFMPAMLHEQATVQEAENLQRLAAQIEMLTAFDLACIDPK